MDFGRTVDAREFEALGPEPRAAVKAVEECIRLQHVGEIDYTDEPFTPAWR